jgi:replicative DNA helicase
MNARPELPPATPAACVTIEQEILGTLLRAPEKTLALVLPITQPEHFYEPLHASIYEAIRETGEAGQPVTMGTVKQRLGPAASGADVGGLTLSEYLAKIIAHSMGGNARQLATTLHELWALRQVAAVGNDIERNHNGYDPGAYLSEKFAQLDAVRASLCDRERTSTTAGQAARAVVARIETALKGNAEPLPSTGIPRLDDELGGGLHRSTLIVVAARTSMGKSIVGTEWADTIAQQGFGVDLFTLEMGSGQIAARRISSRLEREGLRLPFHDIMRANLAPRDAEHVARIARDMDDEGGRFHIEELAAPTIGEIAATAERCINAFVRKGIKPGAVIIDHAHLIKAAQRHGTNEGEVREVSNGALALAKRLELPVVLLAQCNRGPESRADDAKRPGPADLRGSGALEEDADALIFPYRPAYYIERSPEYRAGDDAKLAEFETVKHKLELILDKNRAGRSNVVVDAWVDVALNAIRNRAPLSYLGASR